MEKSSSLPECGIRLNENIDGHGTDVTTETDTQSYTLYKKRFSGVVGLVLLNLVAGLNWPWFGSIATQAAADFDVSVTKVNWLGNIVSLTFLPASLATPFLCKIYGIRRCCFIGAGLLILAAWIRFAGTAKHLNPQTAYALLFIGQVLAGFAQPVFQIVAPKFSEAWFDFNGRTTATMVMSIANPVGAALGQLIPPFVGTTRHSILVLGIISTAVFPACFLIYSTPPSPPTFSGALPSPPPLSTIRSLIGYPQEGDRTFTMRARIDFVIIVFAFGCFVAAANAFSLLTAQIFQPYGYDASDAGLFGASLLLSGLLAAVITAPLFDRVFTKTRYMTFYIKIATPLLGLSWYIFYFFLRPNNAGGIYALMVVIGIISLTLLPLSLELACELSRDAETSSAILWFFANLLGVIFVLVEDALTASADASPPLNMRRGSIFVAVVSCTAAVAISGFQGLSDSRRSLDEMRQREEAVRVETTTKS
ncbi:MFS general substrate transporter [Hysterangium stoloniferum]|nr:MFS general substrate transporter [Hysterangium stoloniferum]